MPIELLGIAILVILALIALYYRIKYKRSEEELERERIDFDSYIEETDNLLNFLLDTLEQNGIKVEFTEYNEEEEENE